MVGRLQVVVQQRMASGTAQHATVHTHKQEGDAPAYAGAWVCAQRSNQAPILLLAHVHACCCAQSCVHVCEHACFSACMRLCAHVWRHEPPWLSKTPLVQWATQTTPTPLGAGLPVSFAENFLRRRHHTTRWAPLQQCSTPRTSYVPPPRATSGSAPCRGPVDAPGVGQAGGLEPAGTAADRPAALLTAAAAGAESASSSTLLPVEARGGKASGPGGGCGGARNRRPCKDMVRRARLACWEAAALLGGGSAAGRQAGPVPTAVASGRPGSCWRTALRLLELGPWAGGSAGGGGRENAPLLLPARCCRRASHAGGRLHAAASELPDAV